MRKIAKQHKVNPQDISSQFAGGASRAPSTGDGPEPADEPAGDGGTEPADGGEPEREKSEYEKNLETSAEGPKMPGMVDDKEVDIF